MKKEIHPKYQEVVFLDTSTAPLSYYLVTGVGPTGEGPR